MFGFLESEYAIEETAPMRRWGVTAHDAAIIAAADEKSKDYYWVTQFQLVMPAIECGFWNLTSGNRSTIRLISTAHQRRQDNHPYKNDKERTVNTFIHHHARRAVAVSVVLLLVACGQQDEAATAVSGAEKVPVTTSSARAMELYEKGRALLDDLHFFEAHELFLQAVDEDPQFAMGHFMVASTSLTAAEFFDAVARADESAAGASPGEQLYIRALVAAAENDQDAQRQALTELVGMFPRDERTHMQLGNFLNGQQDFAGAAEHFTHATQVNPDFAGGYNSLGYAKRSLEDFDGAKAAFAKYVELIPDEANPHDSYAELLMETGDYESSIEHYRKSLSIDPHFGASYAGIAINESLRGRPDLAQEAADQMLAAARNFAERQAALFQSVTAHLYAGDIEAAMEVCDTMLAEATVQGDHAAMGGIHEYMGDVMLVAGDAAKAEEHFAAALESRQRADINDANKAQARRTHLYKTAIAAMIGDDGEAATARAAEFTAAAEADGTAFERRRIHELAGYLAMYDEDMEGAAKHLAQASQLNPVVLYWSAVVNAELGNTDKAADLAFRAANRNTLSPNLPFFRADAQKLLADLNAG